MCDRVELGLGGDLPRADCGRRLGLGLRLRLVGRAYSPGPESPSPPRMSACICCAFASTAAEAERSASFTPARTRSARPSGSDGSIASGEIQIESTWPAPFAVTL